MSETGRGSDPTPCPSNGLDPDPFPSSSNDLSDVSFVRDDNDIIAAADGTFRDRDIDNVVMPRSVG
jgi:hypothetical protein